MILISIVINTTGKNLVNIRRLLYSIKQQNYNQYEIVIATESNGVKIRQICEAIGLKCVILETGYWNKCLTANVAILKSKGELVTILEDDIELEPSWLSKMIKCINNDKRIGCVYSNVINPFGSESLASRTANKVLYYVVRIVNTFRAHGNFARKKITVFSLTVMCRREALLKAGLFDTSVEEPIVAEDYDLAIRVQKAGYKVITCNDAKALHYTRHAYKRTLLALKRGPRWWERLIENDTYFFAKHYDVLGFVVFTHAIYNAFISPLALLVRLTKIKNFTLYFLINIFLRSIEGSLTGLIKGFIYKKKY
jgi:GT2 family glycosyltransferase